MSDDQFGGSRHGHGDPRWELAAARESAEYDRINIFTMRDEIARLRAGEEILKDAVKRLRAELKEAREAIRWCYEQGLAPFPSLTERAMPIWSTRWPRTAEACFAPDAILPAVRAALEEEP